MKRALVLYAGLSSVARAWSEAEFGNGDTGVTSNMTDDGIISNPGSGEGEWNGQDTPDSAATTTAATSADEAFGEATTVAPPATLIYTCGGTADSLAFCEFPFTTLAGNEYTNKCADQVEDNPDFTTDRPWCFTSASQWGFCDCSATFGMTYFTAAHPTNHTLHVVTVEVSIDYPAMIHCGLSVNSSHLPTSSEVNSGNVPGAVSNMSANMILHSIDAVMTFSASLAYIHNHMYLSCQASVPGLLSQPSPIGVILGEDAPEPTGPANDGEDEEEVPPLITTTSGSAMYSLIIIVLIGSFVAVRNALDRRTQLLAFSRINQNESLITHRIAS